MICGTLPLPHACMVENFLKHFLYHLKNIKISDNFFLIKENKNNFFYFKEIKIIPLNTANDLLLSVTIFR